MFRVPADPNHPTFDRTFTVSFRQWLFSKAAERNGWLRRRGAAKHNDRLHQRSGRPAGGRYIAQQPAPQPGRQLSQEQVAQLKAVNRWAKTEKTFLGIQMVILLIPVALCLICVVAAVIYETFYR